MEIQKAGNDSVQIQAGDITINVSGITEERARAICDEKLEIAKREFTQEAHRIAQERIKKLEEVLIPKVHEIDEHYRIFSDPEFQLMLLSAQKTAATTDRPANYELLADLLAHRVENGSDRHVVAGIRRAVEIVNDISEEALLGLTIIHSVNTLVPKSRMIMQGLDVLDILFGKLIYGELPTGVGWIDNLEILNTIRINQFTSFIKTIDIYSILLNGYFVIGIKKDSENYREAVNILQKNDLSISSFLADHDLNNGYVRVPVSEKKRVDYLHVSEKQKSAIKSLFELYEDNADLNEEVKKRLMEQFEKRQNLKKLKQWRDNLKLSFSLTSIGNVLARANAQRCDKLIPDLRKIVS